MAAKEEENVRSRGNVLRAGEQQEVAAALRSAEEVLVKRRKCFAIDCALAAAGMLINQQIILQEECPDTIREGEVLRLVALAGFVQQDSPCAASCVFHHLDLRLSVLARG
eukprot:TRINITY_DN81518_c0_g1_i1.p1 TRINITY_DN81518_c0_g1~~TRINITY_DN81518_c0_g1_i1.p1  ORF type:complete len:110 (+),score=19.12 TRINITY_DN81518_c0_g1_i1:127-456(+)